MIIDILKSSLGNLDAELVFTCPVCGRTFRHNDYEYPARWEDAIRKHLIRNHGGRRIGWDIIELPDDVNPSYTFLSEGGPASPPSHTGRSQVQAGRTGSKVKGGGLSNGRDLLVATGGARSVRFAGSNPAGPTYDEPHTSDQTSHRGGDQPSPLHLGIQEVE